MNNNGASRCPVCNQEPLLTEQPYHTAYNTRAHYIVECPAHGYIGIGDTLNQAIQCYNALVESIKKKAGLQSVIEPGPPNSSPCLYCKRDTTGIAHQEFGRYWVDCDDCRMIKYETYVA